jgi:hypothetical protein
MLAIIAASFRRSSAPTHLGGRGMVAALVLLVIAAPQNVVAETQNPFAAQAPAVRQSSAAILARLLKEPDLAVSRCLLSPDIASDNVTVAVSADRIFEAGDVFQEVDGTALDPKSKNPVRDILLKHPPNGDVSVKVLRHDKTTPLIAHCNDAKAFYDLIIEGLHAGANNDFVGCADKFQSATTFGYLGSLLSWARWDCQKVSGLITSKTSYSLDYYNIMLELIAENKQSADALSRIRGTVLTVIDQLQRQGADSLSMDLKQQLDEATAAEARSN